MVPAEIIINEENYAIIVENDVSDWDDQTGEFYHFPKKYIRILQPGTKVIYYKGNLKDSIYRDKRLSDMAHYFGIATIGALYDDDNSHKGDLFAVIEGFTPFENPILIKYKDEYLEEIPASKLSNYWRDGVRKIDQATYEKILSLAGKLPAHAEAKPLAQTLNDTEVNLESYVEGNKQQRYVTQYERDPKLRKLALLIHGYSCQGCGFNFEAFYGVYGKGFIHVHHLKPVSEFDGPQAVDPKTDLTVLCPNCHSMVHRFKSKTLSLEELRQMTQKQ
jgi:predicted HNH restriction endonuclease